MSKIWLVFADVLYQAKSGLLVKFIDAIRTRENLSMIMDNTNFGEIKNLI